MAAPYVGNPDFRGYLAYQQQNKDPIAGYLLGVVGGDYAGNGTTGLNMNTINNADYQHAPSAFYAFGSPQGVIDSASKYYRNYVAAGAPSGNYSGGGGSVATGPTEAEKAQYRDFTNRAYDTKIGGLRSIMDTLNPQQDAAVLNVNNQWQNQNNALQVQKAQGDRNLQMAGEQVQAGKVKGIADLNRQVQTMGMSYNNQLGAYGAGDSSAAQMIQQALSGQASKNRAGVLQNAGQQQQAIDLQVQDLDQEFQINLKSLEDWKSSMLNDIATKFLQRRQEIQQQMINADADRYQALATIDQNYVNQAIAQLANLEGQYRSGANELIAQYQNIKGPQAQINPALQQFAVQPISAGKIGQIGSVPAVSAGNEPTPLAFRRPFQEEFGFGLSPVGV